MEVKILMLETTSFARRPTKNANVMEIKEKTIPRLKYLLLFSRVK